LLKGWKHFGYAANESRRQSLVGQITALGGKPQYTAISISTLSKRQEVDESAPSSVRTTQRGSPERKPRDVAGEPVIVDVLAILLSSLSLWIVEVRKSNAVADLPFAKLKAARDACRTAARQRGCPQIAEESDPFARFDEHAAVLIAPRIDDCEYAICRNRALIGFAHTTSLLFISVSLSVHASSAGSWIGIWKL